MKSFYDIMSDSDSCITDFERACDELISVKYILADKKISLLMQVVARSKNLYALFQTCMVDFEFSKELKVAKAGGGFKVPEDTKKNIAFVFCLLLSFDTNQTDLKTFLHTFYPNESSPNVEFSTFANEVIEPFKKNVISAYFAEAEEPLLPKAEAVEKEVFEQPAARSYGKLGAYFSSNSPAVHTPKFPVSMEPKSKHSSSDLDELALETLLICAREIIGIVARDASIDATLREEILLVCEGFEDAVQMGVKKAIKVMYIALKYTIMGSPLSRQLETQLNDLNRLITEYEVD